MMSLHTIQNLQQEARKTAAQNNIVPFTVENEDLTAWQQGRSLPLPFPFIGDYEPDGYLPTEDAWMVDTSGVGAPDERALTLDQLLDKLEVGNAYALVEVGQFQAYLQEYAVK